ncbi:MAG: hypothetical protein FWC11_04535 [Firmicutes bacterium]|nr:hypothetical protein [Bacillota bacterium]MCL2256109.1 hypothetical protein [Bacillota bacterium]
MNELEEKIEKIDSQSEVKSSENTFESTQNDEFNKAKQPRSEETVHLSIFRKVIGYVGLAFVSIFTVFLIVFFTDFNRWNGWVGYIVLISGVISIACFFISKSWTKKLDHQIALEDLKEKEGVPLEDNEDIESEINKNAEMEKSARSEDEGKIEE